MSALDGVVSAISQAQQTRIDVQSELSQGFSNFVYEVRTGRNEQWCLRISTDAIAGRVAARGTMVLKRAKEKRPALQAPSVIQFSEEYTLLEFLPGWPLGSWNTASMTWARRQVLLDHLANFLFVLWGAELGDSGTAGSRKSYAYWLRDEVDRGLRRTLHGTSSWGDPIHYLQRRMMIEHLVPRPDDGLIAMKHGDLNAWNIIVTDSGLSGVIDWDNSQIVPAASAVQHPLFIADIPGWRNDGVPEGMTFEEDRAYLQNALGKLEADTGPIAALLESSRERQFFELSLHNSSINEEYVKQRLNGEVDKHAALLQLEDFLSAHESMRSLAKVAEIQADLREHT